MAKNKPKDYWKENMRYRFIILIIWFIVAFVEGIMLKDVLNEFKLFGFKLGFWCDQQGSMYVFVVLIFIYVKLQGFILELFMQTVLKKLLNLKIYLD